MVAVDATLRSTSDHDSPSLTSVDARAPGCVATSGTIAVQMGSDVVADRVARGMVGETRQEQDTEDPQCSLRIFTI